MSDETKTIEAWRDEQLAAATKDEKRQRTHETWYAAAKALRGWPVGKEVTQAEYQQAITDAQGVELR